MTIPVVVFRYPAAILLFSVAVGACLPGRQIWAAPIPDASQTLSETESDASEANQLHENFRLQVHLPPLIIDHRNQGDYFRGRSTDLPYPGAAEHFEAVIERAWPDPWTLDAVVNQLEIIRPRLEKAMAHYRGRAAVLKIFLDPKVLPSHLKQREDVFSKTREVLRATLGNYGVKKAEVVIGFCAPHSTDLQVLTPGSAPSGWTAPWRVEVLNLGLDPEIHPSVNALVTMILQGLAFRYEKITVDSSRTAGLGQVSINEFRRLLSNIFT
ncbi:MAG: hypothetical protein HY594_05380 [Candidatus Omnitrophica bacterium]|nr:hypothetical protein [Candidatus Omnitrophota bacterium]